MERVINFGAGPAKLPLPVLEQAKDELLNWQNTGMSLLEMSHRADDFIALLASMKADIRSLLSVPDNYKILFMHGGARAQFFSLPMNLLSQGAQADYLITGYWSHLAYEEGVRYGKLNRVLPKADVHQCTQIPHADTWRLSPDATYVYYTDNETINGLEFINPPQVGHVPLVSDMTSSLFSKPLDIATHGAIIAGAQKNIGAAGFALVIVREDLLGDASELTPALFDYEIQTKENSLYNTPPTFPIYMGSLVLQWLKAQGGVSAIAKINAKKAKCLYDVIDHSSLYHNGVDPSCRSRMNVVFTLADTALEKRFLWEAASQGLVALKGHRKVGGMRASIYNAMSLAEVSALADFMKSFEKSA